MKAVTMANIWMSGHNVRPNKLLMCEPLQPDVNFNAIFHRKDQNEDLFSAQYTSTWRAGWFEYVPQAGKMDTQDALEKKHLICLRFEESSEQNTVAWYDSAISLPKPLY